MIKGLFFDSIASDRTYDAQEWEDVFGAIVTEGYVSNFLDELLVEPVTPTDLEVQVRMGAAWINGKLVSEQDVINTLVIPSNNSGNTVIHRVVLRVDYSNRVAELDLLEGTSFTTPPALTRDSSIYEVSLAQVEVANGAVEISSGDITDERDNPLVCGKSSLSSNLEHGNLGGLGSDHHTQYLTQARHQNINHDSLVIPSIAHWRPPDQFRVLADTAAGSVGIWVDWGSPISIDMTNYVGEELDLQATLTGHVSWNNITSDRRRAQALIKVSHDNGSTWVTQGLGSVTELSGDNQRATALAAQVRDFSADYQGGNTLLVQVQARQENFGSPGELDFRNGNLRVSRFHAPTGGS